jgi:predicted RNA-binding protein with PUA-like domain
MKDFQMNYWLIKSEPGAWSWADQVKDHRTHWDGVKNYQARNNMKEMAVGDLAFFYHSVKEKRIVGIVKVVNPYYPDLDDPRFGMVDVEVFKEVPQPVTLEAMKEEPALSDLPLIRQSRLSVMPIDKASWDLICKMGSVK